jgi:nuclear GTP-binding protein
MKRIYLIDCPGIVPPNNNDTDESLLLRGSIRVENVEYPAQYIDAVLARVQQRHVQRTYQLKPYNNSTEFLEQLARKYGRMLKGGEPDMDGCAKIVINDWIRGKLPWFTPPPMPEGEAEKGVAGREGRLGEMGKKRKRDEAGNDAAPDASGAEAQPNEDTGSEGQDSEDDDEFEGFDEGGVEIDVQDEDSDDEEADDGGDDDAKTLVAEDDDADDDVEEEVVAISKALAKARKSAKKA